VKFILLCILFLTSVSAETLSEICQRMNGELLNEWQCPTSGKLRKGLFCRVEDPLKRSLVTNGCTGANFGPIKPYASVFLKSCIKHDLCYHHEPTTTGLSKSDCDKNFLIHVTQDCNGVENQKECLEWAQRFYLVVTKFGERSWSCSKEEADYFSLIERL